MSERKKKILVTDDDRSVVETVRANLSLAGYDVVNAYDGAECLELVKSESPDALILDATMPRKDGWAVLKELKSNPTTKTLPIVMLTGIDTLKDMNEAIRLGCDCYLTKPFEPEDILTIVRHLTDESKES